MDYLIEKLAAKITQQDLRAARMDPTAVREFQRKGAKAPFVGQKLLQKLRLLARDTMPLLRMQGSTKLTERDLFLRFKQILRTRNPEVRAKIEEQLERYK